MSTSADDVPYEADRQTGGGGGQGQTDRHENAWLRDEGGFAGDGCCLKNKLPIILYQQPVTFRVVVGKSFIKFILLGSHAVRSGPGESFNKICI